MSIIPTMGAIHTLACRSDSVPCIDAYMKARCHADSYIDCST